MTPSLSLISPYANSIPLNKNSAIHASTRTVQGHTAGFFMINKSARSVGSERNKMQMSYVRMLIE